MCKTYTELNFVDRSRVLQQTKTNNLQIIIANVETVVRATVQCLELVPILSVLFLA